VLVYVGTHVGIFDDEIDVGIMIVVTGAITIVCDVVNVY
jgi:hypothetical protein